MARGRIQGWVEQGGNTVITDGRSSITQVQESFPGASVTVFNAGTLVLATIFSDEGGTPLANPFVADDDGFWGFWADVGRYDVQFSGAGITIPFTVFALEAVLSGEGIIDPGSNGYVVRISANTSVARTLTGTVNRIVITDGNGVLGNSVFDIGSTVATSANNLSFFAATTSAQLAALITNETGTGLLVFNVAPTITTPSISGGTHTALTSLGIRSTGTGAFDLTIANTENLTAGRTLTLTLNNVNRTISINGNVTLANSFTTSGNNALTLTTTGATNVTLPLTGTLATLAGTEIFTNKTLTSPRVGTAILDTNGNEILTVTPTVSAVNEVNFTNAITGTPPIIQVSGGDPNPNLIVRSKGTGRVIIPGYPFTIQVLTNVVGNVTTGLDSLHSYSVLANSLITNNDYIEGVAGGDFLANDAQKRLTFSVNGTNCLDTSLFDIDGSIGWRMQYDIIRLTSTSVRVSVQLLVNTGAIDSVAVPTSFSNSFYGAAFMTDVTVLDLITNPFTVLVQAEAANTNDVTQNLTIAKLIQRA